MSCQLVACQIGVQLGEAVGVVADERVVEHPARGVRPREQHLHHPLEQRDVAVDPHGQVQVGERVARAEQMRGEMDRGRILLGVRVGEPEEPGSASGLIAMIVAPCFFACSSEVSIRGWLVPGFCPTMRMRSVCSKSSSVTVPLPMPRLSTSAVPRGLVAHVGAVGQVVGAELPRRRAGRGTRPRCWRGPRCRTPPGRASRARAAPGRSGAKASSHPIGS